MVRPIGVLGAIVPFVLRRNVLKTSNEYKQSQGMALPVSRMNCNGERLPKVVVGWWYKVDIRILPTFENLCIHS